MQKERFPATSSTLRQYLHRWTLWLVFSCSVLFTITAWHFSNEYIAERANERFAFRVSQITDAVNSRMHSYEQVLRGGVGLFATSPTITRAQWHAYVENAKIAKNFPGIQNMAVDVPIPAADLAAHIASVRQEGFPDYAIHPALPERTLYHSLIYNEPSGGRNLRAFGFDMYTNPVRKAAMDRAIDHGEAAISGMVKLAQETEKDVQFGFIFCLPVYQLGMPQSTVAERRAAFRALVTGAFRANDLMAGIFGSGAQDLELEIFDDAQIGSVLQDTNRLYSSFDKRALPSSRFVALAPLEVGGRKWLLRVTANQKFLDQVSSVQSIAVAIGGILLNLTLFAALSSLHGRERKTRTLADDVTRDLFDKEAHFSRIIASTSEAIVSQSPTGIISSWNPAAEKILGYRTSEALRHPIDKILQTERVEVEQQLMQRVMQGETIDHFETRYRHKEGHFVDVIVSLSLQHDAHGQLLSTTRIMRDISERKLAEQQLYELQYQMLQWVEELPLGLFVLNKNGNVHYANRRAIAILGRGVMPDARPEHLAEIYQVYIEGTDQLYPTENLPVVQALAGKSCIVDDIEIEARENGHLERRKLKVWGQPVYSPSGEVEFGVAAFEDITEHKSALATQALYADIIAASNDAVMGFKLDGTLTAWNPAAERMFGYTMAQMLGQTNTKLVPADRQAEEISLRARLAQGEYIEQFETRRIRQDGSVIDVAVNFSPMRNNSGQVIGTSAVMSNITARKQVDRLKSEFVSTVSHELRTPLTSIRGSIGLVLGGAVGQVPERATSLLKIAANNCERLVRLINDILDIDKLDAGKFHFELKRTDLSALVEQACLNNQTYATQFGVKFVMTSNPGPVFVNIDADRVTQVLANLLSNAAKFSLQGQAVEVAIQQLPNAEVKVSIQDFGAGIPDEFKGRIFQKFAQADASDTKQIQRGGTGLGLNIAKAIIEQLGGNIGFESELGQGACFYFVLKEAAALREA